MTDSTETSAELKKGPNLARWFWGSIIMMAVFSLVLGIAATTRNLSDSGKTTTVAAEGSQPPAPAEASATELQELLNTANKAALQVVTSQIDPLLNAAYEPVYDAIPTYANFHYSVLGEYAELSEAALGNMSGKLQDILFAGLDVRLASTHTKMDTLFSSEFQQALPENTEQAGIHTGPLTRQVLGDAVARMRITAPLATTAALSTGLALKPMAKVMAKKIGAKLAIKAGAKTGGKLATVLAGTGTGAAICSWAGPGAGLCAAAGGLGAWVVADYGIVKLDEYWNREEFESDLRGMVDDQKNAHRKSLEQALAERAVAVQKSSAKLVQKHDFTLRELSGEGNVETCAVAARLYEKFEPMRENLSERKLIAIEALRSEIAGYHGHPSLGPLVQELEENLKKATEVKVSSAGIKGNLPVENRANRKVSGNVYIGGRKIDVSKTNATETDGFNIHLDQSFTARTNLPVTFSIVIEQHLRIHRNRFFGGGGKLDVLERVGNSKGLQHTVSTMFRIGHDQTAKDIENVSKQSHFGHWSTLTLTLRAEPMSPLSSMPECQ